MLYSFELVYEIDINFIQHLISEYSLRIQKTLLLFHMLLYEREPPRVIIQCVQIKNVASFEKISNILKGFQRALKVKYQRTLW